MKKRLLMVTLSMALVVGLAGIVSASTLGGNTTDKPSQASNVTNMEAAQGTNPHEGQLSPTDQISPSPTDSNTLMNSNNGSVNNQIQDMPVNTQMQSMPTSTPMNGPMNNSQHQHEMSGTHSSNHLNAPNATHQSGQRTNGSTMMGSKERMGR